jgi:hypothetical protein
MYAIKSQNMPKNFQLFLSLPNERRRKRSTYENFIVTF